MHRLSVFRPHRSKIIRLAPGAGSASLIALLFACGGRDLGSTSSATGGTVVIATSADADAVFPPLAENVVSLQVTELVYDHLAEIGPEMNVIGDVGFRPELADSWQWSADSLSISFHINPKAHWHDGAQVRARDVSYTYSLNRSPALGDPMGDALRNVDSVTAKDSATAVFWFRSRTQEQFHTAAGLMLILPEHIFGKLGADSSLGQRARQQKPVGSGRFRFRSWTQGTSLELFADSGNYRGRPPLDRLIWVPAPDFQSALTKLLGGEADVLESVRAENLPEIARNPALRVITLPGMDYAFMQLNLRDPGNHAKAHPLFGDRRMRRALTMALDRESMVKNVFDTLANVSIGPTIRALPTTSPTLVQIPCDTVRAAAILDSLGWVRKVPGGVRARGGRELGFTILVPSSSAARKKMAVLIQSQLARIGARVSIEQMDHAAFSAREASRKFDAALGAWHTTPNPSAISEVWSTSASRRKDGRNYGSYESPVFDALIDSASAARDPEASRRLYTRAYQTIIDDAPAIWLHEPKTVIGIHRRIQVAGARPDAWWAGVGEWSIPLPERIERDGTVRR